MGGTRVYKRLNDGAAVAMSIKVAQQEAKTTSVLKRRGDFIFLHSLLSHARHEHRPRLLCSCSNQKGMQSLPVRDMVVWREDKHLGTKQIRILGSSALNTQCL